ncbi:MAG: Gfo/Idh/MocA family protein [Hyphomonadaceae bacterium]
MAPIRIGILGAARIAPRALIKPARAHGGFALQAVAARDPARARAFAAEHAIAEAAADYAALVARDDLDLIYNALPPGMHAEWTIRALEAGKAVLCEKPFAMNAREAQAMVDASARTGRPLMEAFHYRFHDVLVRAFAMARDGTLGALKHAEAHFSVPIRYRPGELRWEQTLGGGALMDLGCYCVHALRMAAGGEPEVASAHVKMKRGVDTRTEARLAFPGGATGTLTTSMTTLRPTARLIIEGEKAKLSILNFVAPQWGCRFTITENRKRRELPTDGAPTFVKQIEHVAAVMRGEALPLTGGADAVANMAAIDAIYAKAGVERG